MKSLDIEDSILREKRKKELHVKEEKRKVSISYIRSLDGIFQVLVIHRNGECLIRRSFTKVDFNEDLFSGFVSAAFTFTKDLGIGELQTLITKKVKVYYLEADEIIFTVMAHKDVDADLIESRLKLLRDHFLSKYKEVSGRWDGNLKNFKDFERIIDVVFGDWQLDKNVRRIIRNLRERKITAIEAANAIIELSRQISKLKSKS